MRKAIRWGCFGLLLTLATTGWAQNPMPLIVDGDGDGVSDEMDDCPYTPPGTVVDARGCPVQGDIDGDGVPDALDDCPYTPKGAIVDAHGCALDSDFDGVPDGIDQCPHTPLGERVEANGCMPGEKPGAVSRVPKKTAAGKPPAPPKPKSRLDSTTSKALDAAIEAALASAPATPAAPTVLPPPPQPPPVVAVEPPPHPEAVTPPAVTPVEAAAASPPPAAAVETPVVPLPATTSAPANVPVLPESPPLVAVAPSPTPLVSTPPVVVQVPPPANPPPVEAAKVATTAASLGAVDFPQNSDELPDSAFVALGVMATAAVEQITVAPTTVVQVRGYRLESEPSWLPRRRAELVRAFLLSRGLEPDQVLLVSGKAGKATGSRRVDLTLEPPPAR